MKAFVLSGGSIKGAFQAGAIAYILEQGFEPALVHGISVGALNGAFLADRAGRAAGAGEVIDWANIGGELEQFWRARIRRPEDIIRRKTKTELAWNALWSRFNGLVGTEPLHALVRSELKADNLRRSPARLFVGAVNLASGQIVYASPASMHIIEYILASAAVPITMPLVEIARAPFYDGGLVDIAPLGSAIDHGATDIVCIVAQPEQVTARDFRRGNVLQLVSRIMDIITTEIVENDLAAVERVNAMIRVHGTGSGLVAAHDYRPVKVTLIRPSDDIDVALDRFASEDIRRMLALGRHAAEQAMK